MEIHAIARYTRVSPTKAAEVIRLLRGKPVREALAMMALNPRKSAKIIYKALQSAVANAENNMNLRRDDLVVKEAYVGPGPMLKRYRPKARGMAGRIRRRMSHFTIILTDEKSKEV